MVTIKIDEGNGSEVTIEFSFPFFCARSQYVGKPGYSRGRTFSIPRLFKHKKMVKS